mgnify:CR=1 FL=1
MPSHETLERVKRIVRESMKLDPATPIEDAMQLMGGEYDMDSLDVLLVVTNIEKEFRVRIREGTMDKSAFATVLTLSTFVETLPREDQ